uniref:Uncharacterized protein n=1 Tax=Siphoviridae sp. ctEP635 TaxID=2825396 RepID=A0A8S5UWU3_9CAUD|nr:MAG TPA: hypothetical protein [Siphoviridae sp. ctEP635]
MKNSTVAQADAGKVADAAAEAPAAEEKPAAEKQAETPAAEEKPTAEKPEAEKPAAETTPEKPADEKPAADAWKAPETREAFDAIIASAVAEALKPYADYEQVKAQAEKLQADATAREKADAFEATRREVAEKFKVPAAVLRGETREDLEAHAQQIKDEIGGARYPVLPAQGTEPAARGGEVTGFLTSLFGQR